MAVFNHFLGILLESRMGQNSEEALAPDVAQLFPHVRLRKRFGESLLQVANQAGPTPLTTHADYVLKKF